MSRALNLVDAVVEQLKPTFGKVFTAMDPWDDTLKTPEPTLFVFADPQGEQREDFAKGKTKETLAILVAASCVLENDWTFRRLMGFAEQVVDWAPTEKHLTCDGITWTHKAPNKWRHRYEQGFIKEGRNGQADGVFASFIELPFWRAF